MNTLRMVELKLVHMGSAGPCQLLAELGVHESDTSSGEERDTHRNRSRDGLNYIGARHPSPAIE
jgi:hypothetical protein